MTEKVQNQVVQKEQISKALKSIDKNIADLVFRRVNELESQGQLVFPANYAVGNALKSAYLILLNTKDKNGRPALEVCTKESIANALLDMVLQGLNPAKKQCYFIVRGDQLQLHISYFGHIVAVKTAIPTVEDIYATEIFEGDEVEIEITNGKKIVKSHKTKFENRDNPLKGAYSVIINKGKIDFELMTMKEIQAAWAKSSSNNQTTHKEFPQEMAKKTVLNRHCKRYVNTSDDSAALAAVEAYQRTIANEYIDADSESTEQLQLEVDTIANQEPLVIEHEPEPEPEPETPTNETLFDDELGF